LNRGKSVAGDDDIDNKGVFGFVIGKRGKEVPLLVP
jgi:hypothetical protein